MDAFQILIMAAAVGLAVLLLFAGILSMTQRDRGSVQRLQAYTSPPASTGEEGQALTGFLEAVNQWMVRRSFGASIARNLAQADIKLTVAEYILLHVALLSVGLMLGPLIFGSALAGVLVGLLTLVAPKFYVSSAQSKRRRAFDEQLPSALNSLSNSLRGGYGFVQAMKLVATEMPPPIATEFQRVVSEVSYGLAYDAAFRNMLRRNTSPDLSLVVTAIEINLEVGGNLAEILDSISAIIRDRVRIQAQVQALTSMTRFSSTVLTFMPVGLGALIYVVNRPYISLLWSSTAGLALLGLAVGLVVVGKVVMGSLSKIDV